MTTEERIEMLMELQNVDLDEARAIYTASLRTPSVRVYHCACPEREWVEMVRAEVGERVEAL